MASAALTALDRADSLQSDNADAWPLAGVVASLQGDRRPSASQVETPLTRRRRSFTERMGDVYGRCYLQREEDYTYLTQRISSLIEAGLEKTSFSLHVAFLSQQEKAQQSKKIAAALQREAQSYSTASDINLRLQRATEGDDKWSRSQEVSAMLGSAAGDSPVGTPRTQPSSRRTTSSQLPLGDAGGLLAAPSPSQDFAAGPLPLSSQSSRAVPSSPPGSPMDRRLALHLPAASSAPLPSLLSADGDGGRTHRSSSPAGAGSRRQASFSQRSPGTGGSELHRSSSSTTLQTEARQRAAGRVAGEEGGAAGGGLAGSVGQHMFVSDLDDSRLRVAEGGGAISQPRSSGKGSGNQGAQGVTELQGPLPADRGAELPKGAALHAVPARTDRGAAGGGSSGGSDFAGDLSSGRRVSDAGGALQGRGPPAAGKHQQERTMSRLMNTTSDPSGLQEEYASVMRGPADRDRLSIVVTPGGTHRNSPGSPHGGSSEMGRHSPINHSPDPRGVPLGAHRSSPRHMRDSDSQDIGEFQRDGRHVPPGSPGAGPTHAQPVMSPTPNIPGYAAVNVSLASGITRNASIPLDAAAPRGGGRGPMRNSRLLSDSDGLAQDGVKLPVLTSRPSVRAATNKGAGKSPRRSTPTKGVKPARSSSGLGRPAVTPSLPDGDAVDDEPPKAAAVAVDASASNKINVWRPGNFAPMADVVPAASVLDMLLDLGGAHHGASRSAAAIGASAAAHASPKRRSCDDAGCSPCVGLDNVRLPRLSKQ